MVHFPISPSVCDFFSTASSFVLSLSVSSGGGARRSLLSLWPAITCASSARHCGPLSRTFECPHHHHHLHVIFRLRSSSTGQFPCVVFSFGQSNDWSFEMQVAERLGCRVHMFRGGSGNRCSPLLLPLHISCSAWCKNLGRSLFPVFHPLTVFVLHFREDCGSTSVFHDTIFLEGWMDGRSFLVANMWGMDHCLWNLFHLVHQEILPSVAHPQRRRRRHW